MDQHQQQLPPPPQVVFTQQQPQQVARKPMWVAKLALRLLQIVFDLVIIGLTARFAVSLERWLSLALFLPPAVVSLIWAATEAIVICVRAGHRGTHPGACVGIDLVLFLGIIAVAVLFGLSGWMWYWGYDDYYYGYYDYYYGPYDYGYDDSDIQDGTRLARAAFAFIILLGINHFVCFVIACVETARRNSQPSIIYYQPAPGQPPMGMMAPPQGMYAPPPPGGHYSMMAAPGSEQQPTAYPPRAYQAGGQYKPYDAYQGRSPSLQHATSEVSSPTPQLGQELPSPRDGHRDSTMEGQ